MMVRIGEEAGRRYSFFHLSCRCAFKVKALGRKLWNEASGFSGLSGALAGIACIFVWKRFDSLNFLNSFWLQLNHNLLEKLNSNYFFCHQLWLHSETIEVSSPPSAVATLCLFCLYAKAVVTLTKYSEVQLMVKFSSRYKFFQICLCDSVALN